MKKTFLILALSFMAFVFSPECFVASGVEPVLPLRIVSLAPSTTEILFALGLDKEIVGVSQYCRFPAQALKKEKVGNVHKPMIEKILWLKPDLIVCAGIQETPLISRLKQLNFKIYTSDPANFEELFRSIQDIGALVHREKQAAALVEKLRKDLRTVLDQVKSVPPEQRPKVFLEIWHSPFMTAGQGSFINEMLTLAGGKNIADDIPRSYVYVTSEFVIQRNPDCIILADMGKGSGMETMTKRLGWDHIAAVKQHRVYGEISSDLLLHSGPRLVEGLKEIHKRLYP